MAEVDVQFHFDVRRNRSGVALLRPSRCRTLRLDGKLEANPEAAGTCLRHMALQDGHRAHLSVTPRTSTAIIYVDSQRNEPVPNS